MRLLLITALYPPSLGGAATYFGEIAPRLARQKGLEAVIVLTEAFPGQPQRLEADGVTILRLLPRRASGKTRPFLVHALTYFLTQAWFVRRLARLVKAERIDVVHFHTRYRGRPFYRALRRLKLPIVADLRDKLSDPARLAPVADALLCCGEGVAHFARSGGFPPERIVHLPIPFSPPPHPSSAARTAVRAHFRLHTNPFLLFVGDLTANKGIEELLAAFAHWRRQHPECLLLVVGVNRLGWSLHRRLARAGVRYLGPLPPAEVRGLMAEAAMVLLPSRSEGLPRVILEAVALGTRVVCPPHIPEFDRHLRPFVLPRVDVPSLAAAIERVWQMTAAPAYPFASHDPGQIADGLMALYRRLQEQAS